MYTSQERGHMMYLSKWQFPSSLGKNPYSLHRILWKAFPGEEETRRPFLFRADCNGKNLSVIMLSDREPLPVEGDYLLRANPFDIRLSPSPYAFSLRANPVKRLSQARCRVPVVGEDSLRNWLIRKTEGICSFEKVIVSHREEMHFRKAGIPGKIVSVDYEGLLAPHDPEALLLLIKQGIGPAKAFGCGLLLLKRL